MRQTLANQVNPGPATEILFAWGQGGSVQAQTSADYAANPEFTRLLASGFLDPATYADADLELSHVLVVDGLVRRGASKLCDDARWPTYSRPVMRAAALRSLRSQSGLGAAEAPDLLLYGRSFRDGTTGATLARISLPADLGRILELEVELFGTGPEPGPHILRLRLCADAGLGAGDPVLAEETALIPARLLAISAYGQLDRPRLGLRWTITDPAGADGVYLRLDAVRISDLPAAEQADALFNSQLSPLAPWYSGRPHYDTHYGSYRGPLASLEVDR